LLEKIFYFAAVDFFSPEKKKTIGAVTGVDWVAGENI